MNWKPISEKPQTTQPMSALIASHDREPEMPDLEWYMLGVYCWNGERWVDEESGRRLPPGDHYWLAEDELIAGLKAVAA